MKYNKETTKDKKNIIVSPKTRQHSKRSLFIYKYILIICIAIFVIILGAGFGFIRGILKNTPSISLDSIHKSGYVTTIYNSDYEKIGSIRTQDAKKNYKKLSSLPSNLQNAFIAIEDTDFYSHNGIDIYGVFRDVLLGVQDKSHVNSGNTITEQLVQNNILGDAGDNTFIERIERKIQEQYLSYELEKISSKQTILEEYLNTINLGDGTTGVQAASKRYFNKDAASLTLSECAVLAALVKNPTKYNPFDHPDANASRRLVVLQNMLEEHYITKDEYKKAINDNIYSRLKKLSNTVNIVQNNTSDFENALISQVVIDLQTQLGYDESKAYSAVYNGGLKIYSTQDSKIQSIANQVVNDESNYPAKTKLALRYSITLQRSNGTDRTYSENDVLVYMKKHKLGNSLLFHKRSTAKAVTVAFKKSVMTKKDRVQHESFSVSIQPQVSMTVMNQYTGAVEALIGGRDNRYNNPTLNRAILNTEQPGTDFSILSTFLPGLDNGTLTLASVFDDAPYQYIDTNETVTNGYQGYRGFSSVRSAITNSMNIVAAKAMSQVTPATSYEYLTKLGFTTLVDAQLSNKGQTYSDIHQSLALGNLTYGVTNLELTNAYTVIANGGSYQSPRFYTKVVNRDGTILLKSSSSSKQVIKDSTSYLLTNALEDSISNGSSSAAKLANNVTCAGSSSTSLTQSDAWMSGFTPYHTASVWVGYDNKAKFSSSNCQDTIWKKVMDQVTIAKKEKNIGFSKPSSVTSATICSASGKLALPGICDHDPRGTTVSTELFTKDTVPTDTCDVHTKVTLCKETNEIATKNCPHTYDKVFLLRSTFSKGTTDDTPFLLPKNLKTCTKHR